jgi:hypothetical protein
MQGWTWRLRRSGRVRVRDSDEPRRATGGRRVLLPLVAAISLLVGAVTTITLAAEQPASAATCWGDWCSGRDPQATGCANDAYTVAHARIPGTYTNIELRWSPSCKTEWARVPASWGKSYPSNLRAVQPSTGYSQIGVVASNGTYSWTRQIYSPSRCVYAAWVGPPGSVGTACW